MRHKVEILAMSIMMEAILFCYLLSSLWGFISADDDVVVMLATIGIPAVFIIWIELILKQVKYLFNNEKPEK